MINNVPNNLQLNSNTDFIGYFFTKNPSPMWVFDVATLAFLEVNPSAIKLYGYSREEFLQMTIKDIRPQEDVELLETQLASLSPLTLGGTVWRHSTKTGQCIWVTISSFEAVFNNRLVRLVTVNNVTKYRQQELALRLVNKELREYKAAITASSIISITDCEGIIEYVNDNFTQLTGYSRDELVGSKHSIINSGYHPNSFWQQMWQTVLAGTTWHGEVCNRKKNGETYWADSFIVPIMKESGGIERIFSFRIDITARKNKENEVAALNSQLVVINANLTESKKELEKLSLVAKLTASEVMILDKDRRITWVNDAFTRLTGFTLDEVYGRRPSECLHGPNSNIETTKQIQEAIINRLPFKKEIIHYSKEGKECHLLTDGQPVLDADGNLVQYVIVETDITELKEKQEAVRNSEIKLNAFFSITANLHLLVDKELRVLAFNKVAEDFMTHAMQTSVAVGDYLPAKLPSPIKQSFTRFATRAIKGIATNNRQADIGTATGSLVWLVNYQPAYDRAGNIIGCAYTAADITASKIAEDKINSQNAILKDIAWKQSHIVRAPLANILSITSLLEGQIADESLRQALMHETQKLDGIIKEIVDKTVEAKTQYY